VQWSKGRKKTRQEKGKQELPIEASKSRGNLMLPSNAMGACPLGNIQEQNKGKVGEGRNWSSVQKEANLNSPKSKSRMTAGRGKMTQLTIEERRGKKRGGRHVEPQFAKAEKQKGTVSPPICKALWDKRGFFPG